MRNKLYHNERCERTLLQQGGHPQCSNDDPTELGTGYEKREIRAEQGQNNRRSPYGKEDKNWEKVESEREPKKKLGILHG